VQLAQIYHEVVEIAEPSDVLQAFHWKQVGLQGIFDSLFDLVFCIEPLSLFWWLPYNSTVCTTTSHDGDTVPRAICFGLFDRDVGGMLFVLLPA
jgi:hypothetical protein